MISHVSCKSSCSGNDCADIRGAERKRGEHGQRVYKDTCKSHVFEAVQQLIIQSPKLVQITEPEELQLTSEVTERDFKEEKN